MFYLDPFAEWKFYANGDFCQNGKFVKSALMKHFDETNEKWDF